MSYAFVKKKSTKEMISIINIKKFEIYFRLLITFGVSYELITYPKCYLDLKAALISLY